MSPHTFREKPKPQDQLASVTAIQWRGDNNGEIETFTRGEFDKELDPTGERVAFILIHTNRGTRKVGVGDWIVRRDGVLDAMSAAEFAENFALEDEPGAGEAATVTRLQTPPLQPVPSKDDDPAENEGDVEPEAQVPTTSHGDTYEGEATAPYPGTSWGTTTDIDYPDHVIGEEDITRSGVFIGLTYTCSCGWASPVASSERELAMMPARDHVEAVSLQSARTNLQQQKQSGQ